MISNIPANAKVAASIKTLGGTKSKSASIGLTKRHNLAIMTAALMVASKADKQDAKQTKEP